MVLGILRNIGWCSAYEAELLSILDSFEQAWAHGCCDMLLEIDYLQALHHVKCTLMIH